MASQVMLKMRPYFARVYVCALSPIVPCEYSSPSFTASSDGAVLNCVRLTCLKSGAVVRRAQIDQVAGARL